MLKIVLFYNQGNRGWTETWWSEGETPPYTLNTALMNIFKLAVAFRSPLTTLEWVRFSVVGSPQKVNSFRLANKVAAQTNPESPPDVVSTDAVWKMITDTFARRTISLRGLLDDSVVRDPVSGAPMPTAGLVSQVEAYLKAVQKAPWMIRSIKTSVNTPGWPKQKVTSVNADPVVSTRSRLTLVTPLANIVVGDKLRFTGKVDPKALPLFPTSPTIIAITDGPPQVVTIEYEMPNNLIYFPTNLIASELQYNYEPIFSYDFQSLSKRDTGRPFGSGRGRRSAAGSRR